MRHSAAPCLAACLMALWTTVSPAAGPDVLGRWDREDGLGGIDISSCNDSLCGRIVWLKETNTPAKIGQEVLFDMRQTAAGTWTGSANNPEDGRTYSGTMTLAGARLMTKGCILGGLLCQFVALTRPRAE